ncbi:MAG TPA: hypothetical protein RMH99_06725 [Sandaracinaceae bacterium LLY-WYZ-13_1]|nr:hypothetical protein [Sandaracinaceae bacterium LLY-WYZ-13_1]
MGRWLGAAALLGSGLIGLGACDGEEPTADAGGRDAASGTDAGPAGPRDAGDADDGGASGDGGPTGDPDDFEILFHQDFDALPAGAFDASTFEAVWEQEPRPFGPSRWDRAEVVGGGDRLLRLTYPASGGPNDGGGQWTHHLGEDPRTGAPFTELYLSYRVRLGDAFDSCLPYGCQSNEACKADVRALTDDERAALGVAGTGSAVVDYCNGAQLKGKLPGFCGGTCPTGGVDSSDGFSARMEWAGAPSPSFYLYYPDRPGPWGDSTAWRGPDDEPVVFERGAWVVITHRVVLNTTYGADANGVAEGYWNGRRVAARDDVQWRREGAGYGLDYLLFSVFINGNDNYPIDGHVNEIAFDDFVVYRWAEGRAPVEGNALGGETIVLPAEARGE